MKRVTVLTAEEAANLVEDGATLSTSGFVASCIPETLNKALEQRFLTTGKPEGLTLVFVSAQGNRDGSASDHFAYPNMVKRVISGHWDRVPRLGKLVLSNKIQGYNLPQGILACLLRDIAGHRIGMVTHVGLNTFVDPRNGGGKLNTKTQENLVEVIHINGEEKLLYKSFPINIAFIRGTYADETGNISFEKEIAPLEATSMAQAVKNSGGKVIVQVEKIVKAGTLDPKLVKIPGIYVYGIVIGNKEDQQQCLGCDYDTARTGDIRVP